MINNNFSRRLSGWLPLLALFVGVLPARGQIVNATLSGSVTDTSGAGVPGASITATGVSNGVVKKTVSDELGNYFLPYLAPAEYTLTVEMRGFRPTVMSGITLLVNQQAHVDVQLQVGQVTSKVEVTGAPPQVETTTASVGTVIGDKEVDDLPLNLRRFGSLATLVPGTINDMGGSATVLGYGTFSEQTYVANGARDDSNLTLIDGVDSRNIFGGGFGLQPPPDAIEEFKIQTNNYSAAFGVAAGSIINLVTKSGTNEFHGSAYEFVRNSDLDARNFFATNQVNPVTGEEIPGSARPEYRRNQFGFTIGGPIRKNKTFFFGNFDGLRLIQGLSLGGFVPTDVEKSGNLSSFLTGNMVNLCGAGGPANLNFDSGQLFDPGTESLYTCPSGTSAGSTILMGSPIPGDVITNIDSVAQKALAYYPEPNRPGYPNYVNQQPENRHDDQFDVRVDHVIGPKDQLYARYLMAETNWNQPQGGYTVLPNFGTQEYFRGQNLALAWTHTFGTDLLNEARFGFQRNVAATQCEKCPYPAGTTASFGIENLAGSTMQEAVPLFSLVNFAGVGDGPYVPSVVPDMIEKYQDNLTWTHGRHTLVAGTDMQFVQLLHTLMPGTLTGKIYFNGQYSSLAGEVAGVSGVSDLADFLLGYPDSAERSFADHFEDVNAVGMGIWSYYAQDSIKMTSKLTINLGLRYEYRRQPVDKRDNITNVVFLGPPFSGPGNATIVTALPEAENDAICTNPFYSYLLTPDGRCLIASSSERAKLGFTGRTRRSLMFPYYGDWGPRIGIAWRPLNTDKLVIRTGYGMFYDTPLFNQFNDGNSSPVESPSESYITAFGSPPPLYNGQPTKLETVFAAGTVPSIAQSIPSFHPGWRWQDPRLQEWSFGTETQLSQNLALEVDYIGNVGEHLGDLHLFGNQPSPGVGPIQPRRPYPDLGSWAQTTPDADSNYNSLQAKLTKRFSHGMSFLTSYTFGHGLSTNEGDEGFAGGFGNLAAQNDNDRDADYGRTYEDARHRLVFSYDWQLPIGMDRRFLNRRGPLDAVLGGWTASGIVQLQSGVPFTVLSAQDFSNTGTLSARPDRTCNGTGQKTVNDWFDATCFTTSALEAALTAGTPRFGNSGRNILDGPGIANWDFALLKNFHFGERLTLQLRGEFFDFLNAPHFGLPAAYIGTANVGQISSATDPRDVQVALKLLF